MSVSPDCRPDFFCSAKRNRGKKRQPPAMACGFPALLAKKRRLAQRALADYTNRSLLRSLNGARRLSLFGCATRHGSRGFERPNQLSGSHSHEDRKTKLIPPELTFN